MYFVFELISTTFNKVCKIYIFRYEQTISTEQKYAQ